MLNNTKTWLIIIGIVLAIGAIVPTASMLADRAPTSTQDKPAIVSLTGTVRKVPVAGNCYQLQAGDGKNYELIGKFPKREGAKIQVTGTIETEMVTICQIGQPFKVKSAKALAATAK